MTIFPNAGVKDSGTGGAFAISKYFSHYRLFHNYFFFQTLGYPHSGAIINYITDDWSELYFWCGIWEYETCPATIKADTSMATSACHGKLRYRSLSPSADSMLLAYNLKRMYCREVFAFPARSLIQMLAICLLRKSAWIRYPYKPVSRQKHGSCCLRPIISQTNAVDPQSPIILFGRGAADVLSNSWWTHHTTAL